MSATQSFCAARPLACALKTAFDILLLRSKCAAEFIRHISFDKSNGLKLLRHIAFNHARGADE